MKKTLFATAMIATLIPIAVAQNNRVPQASLDRELSIPQAAGIVASDQLAQTQTPPTFCKRCLFYAGDFDWNASDANGLANEVDLLVPTGAATYTPFIVPKGKIWTVTGLLTVNAIFERTLDPKVIPYEVRKDIPKLGGNGGHLVCHGKKTGTLVILPFNTCGEPGDCFATIVNNVKSCRLTAGKYWLSVIPYCTNKNTCSEYRAFLLNDDGAMAHRYGPLEPANNSFFNSKFFGANWEPTTDQQTSKRFSAGVEGTVK